MNVIIAGGRDFHNYDFLCEVMYQLFAHRHPTVNYNYITVVSGMAKGADAIGHRWATERGLEVLEFPADWETYGPAAGPLRNMQMAEVADMLVAFWDGSSRGTKHMIDTALRYGPDVHVYRY